MKRIIALPLTPVVLLLLALPLLAGRAQAQSDPSIVIDNPDLVQSDVELFTSYSEDSDPEVFFWFARSRGVGMERALAVVTKLALVCAVRRELPDSEVWRYALENTPDSMNVKGIEFKLSFTGKELDLIERDMEPITRACERLRSEN